MDDQEASMEDQDEQESMMEDRDMTTEKGPRQVYLPGHQMNEEESLVFDPSAYHMLHDVDSGLPCLSFDVIADDLGSNRNIFPHTMYLVAGSQAEKPKDNCVIVMKLSNLNAIKKDESSSSEDSDVESDSSDEESNDQPVLQVSALPHFGTINRIRSTAVNGKVFGAVWSERGVVNMYDLNTKLKDVEKAKRNRKIGSVEKKKKHGKQAPKRTLVEHKPLHSFSGHRDEGYALDWSDTTLGVLASGDCKGNIHIWKPSEGSWTVDLRSLEGHKESVEDLQWSPNEPNVIASCSVDRSLRIWDTRLAPNKANMLTIVDAHDNDINVINWNKKEPLIVSGGDDGKLMIWDLRQFKKGKDLATFKHHTSAITTVEWNPDDSSVFASGGDDHQIAIWDLAVERDTTNEQDDIKEIPPQLLFIHQGQEHIKELHWHPQVTGVLISTAQSGFNVFRTISV
ncbi:glutamate-rich WD repeat-containing protein 1 [Daktulosphaira vitifoliae]|uniref:glutamate-rich WD repeat-containing protein 1 n=1 Tax=Daktulosphaira vitifoliae TaxID=58002 RepID=UPI0021A9C908|nr:glutamate-rich WD repeat-containing protein 1 [Daktulosphaira vitifoliae]